MSSFTIPDLSWSDPIFDGMMVNRMKVYRRDQTLDRYNNVSNTIWTPLQCTMPDGSIVDEVPCLVRNLKGEELNTPPAPASQTSYGIQEFLVFCRPITVVDTVITLTIRHFLQVHTANQVKQGASWLDPNDPNAKAVLFNLTNISNPALIDHHFELAATVLTP